MTLSTNTMQSVYSQYRVNALIPRTWKQITIFTVILLNSQILSSTSSNPIGIKGFQESFYLFLVLFSLAYILIQLNQRHRVVRADIILLAIGLLIYIYPSIAAGIRFGQPIYYGLLEERRLLSFLVYFPLMWAMRSQVISLHQLLSWVVLSGIVCAVISVFVVTGVITPTNIEEAGKNALRVDRYGIGQQYISVSALIVVHRMKLSNLFSTTILIIILVGVLVLVVQSRQVIFGFLIALLVLRSPTKTIYLGVSVLIIGFWSISESMLIHEYLERYKELAAVTASYDYFTESVRAQTIGIVLNEFVEGYWLGSGSLSLLWSHSFDYVYGPNFYLVDVGIFGTLYKYGLLLFPIYYYYAKWQWSGMKKIADHPYFPLALAIWVQLIVMLPVAAIIEYRGYVAGLLLAVTLGCAIERKKNPIELCGNQTG